MGSASFYASSHIPIIINRKNAKKYGALKFLIRPSFKAPHSINKPTKHPARVIEANIISFISPPYSISLGIRGRDVHYNFLHHYHPHVAYPLMAHHFYTK